MTEYELSDLFVTTVTSAGNVFLSAATIITGFLIIGLYFGQLLDRLMTGLLVASYSVLMLVTIAQVNRAYSSIAHIGREIQRRAEAGNEFQWHSITETPGWLLAIGSNVAPGLLVFGYIASLIFFFRTRKIDPKAFR